MYEVLHLNPVNWKRKEENLRLFERQKVKNE